MYKSQQICTFLYSSNRLTIMEPSVSIKQFYDGTEIFMTGGSGFIGKVLIEKLLHSCQGIKAIYLLMRPKKEVSAKERVQKLLDNTVSKKIVEQGQATLLSGQFVSFQLFERLKKKNPEAFKKLHVIEGDATELNLGISESDMNKLKSCSVIFHGAATIRFDDPLNKSILLNTRGTREVCNLARTMPNLKAFIHISTAYVQPKNKYVQEKMYPSDADWKTFIKYAETLDEDVFNCLTLKWVPTVKFETLSEKDF